MDNHSKEVRSYNMSRIRSTNSKPEEIVRKHLFSQGFRYRKNDKRYPGKPDIVLPKYKTVIFIHGCFWHMHDSGRFVWPSSNAEYWEKKIAGNIRQDEENMEKLQVDGWKVITVWKCKLKTKVRSQRLEELIKAILHVSGEGGNCRGQD